MKTSTDYSTVNSAIRGLLMSMIRLDSDLSAFLIDHFPSIASNVSSTMDMTAKLNHLITKVDAENILSALKEYHRQYHLLQKRNNSAELLKRIMEFRTVVESASQGTVLTNGRALPTGSPVPETRPARRHNIISRQTGGLNVNIGGPMDQAQQQISFKIHQTTMPESIGIRESIREIIEVIKQEVSLIQKAIGEADSRRILRHVTCIEEEVFSAVPDRGEILHAIRTVMEISSHCQIDVSKLRSAMHRLSFSMNLNEDQ